MDFYYFLIIGLLLITNLFKEYLFSYFKEKAKNLATKEDIEEITKKVEQIKNEFVKESEQFKAKLEILISGEQEFIKEKFKAIVEFWISCDKVINEVRNRDFTRYNNRDAVERIDNDNNIINITYAEISMKYSKLNLLIDDNNIIHLAISYTSIIMKSYYLFTNFLYKIKKNFISKPFPHTEVFGKDEVDLQTFYVEHLKIDKEITEKQEILIKKFREYIENSYKNSIIKNE